MGERAELESWRYSRLHAGEQSIADFLNVSTSVRSCGSLLLILSRPPRCFCVASHPQPHRVRRRSSPHALQPSLDTSCKSACVKVHESILNANMTQSKLLSVSEISKHNSDTDCWIVVDGQVWDITGFAPEHPGGPGSQCPASQLHLPFALTPANSNIQIRRPRCHKPVLRNPCPLHHQGRPPLRGPERSPRCLDSHTGMV